MARKLKVFQAQFGFYDSVIAAPSQAAALTAWGTRQNLFHDGGAHAATDENAIEAALANPGVPLLRAIGSNDPFTLHPRLPHLPDEPRPAPNKVATKAKAPAKAPPDRSALDKAEAALQALEAERHRETATFDERRRALAADESVAAERFAAARAQAEGKVRREQDAFRRAGGS